MSANRLSAHEASIIDRLSAGQSVLIVGEAGVGKTHLARAAGERLTASGWGVEQVVGSASLRTVPFGAVHHLVGRGAAPSPDELFSATIGHLERTSRERSTLVIVDDVDGLDDGSAALVHRLAVVGVPIIGTVRTLQASEPHVVPLWKDGALERIDLVAHETDVASLATAFLGVPCERGLIEELQRLSRGNPLFIRELTVSGRSSGSIEIVDDVALLRSPLPVAERIADLLADRLRDVPSDMLSTLETIAHICPVSAAAVMSALPASTVERLETRGLIHVTTSSGVETIDMEHPLVGEVIRAQTPSLRARRLRSDAASAILRSGAELPDLVRALHWMLDANERPTAAHLERGVDACLSRFDAKGALRFAAVLPDSFDAWMTRADAHLRLGNLSERVTALSHAADIAANDIEHAAVARAEAGDLRWVQGDKDTSRHTLERALEHLTMPNARGQVTADLLLGDAIDGNLSSAIDLGLPMLDEPDLDESTELSLLVLTTIAQALTGQVDGLEQRLKLGLELANRHQSTHPAATAQLALTVGQFELGRGRFDQAWAVLDKHLAPPRAPALDLFFEQMAAQLEFFQAHGGRAAAALARVSHIDNDVFGMAVLRDAFASLVFASAGDTAESKRMHQRAIDNPGVSVREQVFLSRAAAHRAAKVGDVEAAVDLLVAAEQHCGDNRLWILGMLHDAVRFGDPAAVLERMEASCPVEPHALLDAMLEHARAGVDKDSKRLALAGETFAEMRSPLYGAEALAQAAGHAIAGGESSDGARYAVRAQVLFNRTDSMWSLAMEQCQPGLSAREFEVAELAASRLSTRQIAEQLFLSARTVDNHLRQVFRKLDLSGRAELGPLFT